MSFLPDRLTAKAEALYNKANGLAESGKYSDDVSEDLEDLLIAVRIELSIDRDESLRDLDTEKISHREGLMEKRIEKLLDKYEGHEVAGDLREIESLMSSVRVFADPDGCF